MSDAQQPINRKGTVSFYPVPPRDIGLSKVAIEKTTSHRALTVGGLTVVMTKAQAREIAKELW